MGCAASQAREASDWKDVGPTANGKVSAPNAIDKNVGTQITSVYEIEEKIIGEGNFATVSKCMHKKTQEMRALKSISKPSMSNYWDPQRLKQEILLHRSVSDHPSILQMIEAFEDNRNIYLVLELCTGGDLFDWLVDAGHFTERQAAGLMRQILSGVTHLHTNSVAHRDLKPENFLFSVKGDPEKTSLKLTDFGFAIGFEPDKPLTTKAGTAYYLAPQVMAGKYNEKCDVWSCGVIMYILLSGNPPFTGETDAEVLEKVQLGNFSFSSKDWKGVSNDAKSLIRKCLKMNPRDRYSAQQAFEDVWIRDQAPNATDVDLSERLIHNLHAFVDSNKLRRAALHTIARRCDDEAIAHLRERFVALDANDDGLLTLQELTTGLERADAKVNLEDLRPLFKQIDVNGTGSIDYTEFLAAAMDRRVWLREELCWEAFRGFDKDGDGVISRQELAQVLKNGELNTAFGTHTIETILVDIDANRDGKISFDEFMQMMRGKAEEDSSDDELSTARSKSSLF